MDYTLINSRLFLGACPKNTADVDLLERACQITAVLNVQTDDDMHYYGMDWAKIEKRYRDSGIRVERVPIRDFDEVDLRARLSECVDALNELMESGHSVYVHCSVGLYRSPSVVTAYLHWYCDRELDEAAQQVKHLRSCAPSLEAIRLASQDRLRA